MNPGIAAFLALLLFTGHTVAAATPDTAKSLLWKISGKNLDKPSYIFGTIHLICEGDYLWTPAMQNGFEKTDEVCFEMDLDDPAVMMSVALGMADNSGKALKDYFTPGDYAKLSAYIRDSLGMNIGMFSGMKPTILPMLLSGRSPYCATSVSYEDRLMQAATAARKRITGLETPEEQIALFNSLPADSVVKEVMEIVNGRRQDDSTYRKLIAAYTTQDLAALYDLLRKSDDLADNMNAFVDDRNIKWLSRIVDRMDQGSVFFAVGAGHLWGENGVISLLQKDGYIVMPVK